MSHAVRFTGESKALIEKLEANVTLLAHGWREKVDYVTEVKYHDKAVCHLTHAQAVGCECPTKEEKRTRHVKVDSLLDQLKEYTKSKDVDRNPKAARQAPRVKKVKYMPELNGFFTLDEIVCDAYITVDRVYEEAGRNRLDVAASINAVVGNMPYQVSQFVDTRPDLATELVKATSKWVAAARRTLNLSVADAMFEGVVCGNCGGGLSVAWDNSSDVRCVGTPAAPPCGTVYPMSEWVSLYEKGRNADEANVLGLRCEDDQV